MATYRVVLLWSLRVASALVLALAAFGAVSSTMLYNEMQASYGPAELAAAPTPVEIAIGIVPAAGLALLGLALAKILALQLRNKKNSQETSR